MTSIFWILPCWPCWIWPCVSCIVFLWWKFSSTFEFDRITKTKRRFVSAREIVSENSLISNDRIPVLKVGGKSSASGIASAIKSFQSNNQNLSIQEPCLVGNRLLKKRGCTASEQPYIVHAASSPHWDRIVSPFPPRAPFERRRNTSTVVHGDCAARSTAVNREHETTSAINPHDTNPSDILSISTFLAQTDVNDQNFGSISSTLHDNQERESLFLTSEPQLPGNINCYNISSSAPQDDQVLNPMLHSNLSKRKHDVELETEYRKHFRSLQAMGTTVLLDDTLFSVQFDKDPLPVHISADDSGFTLRSSVDVISHSTHSASLPNVSDDGGSKLNHNAPVTNGSVLKNAIFGAHQVQGNFGKEVGSHEPVPGSGPSTNLGKSSSGIITSMSAHNASSAGFGTCGLAAVSPSTLVAPTAIPASSSSTASFGVTGVEKSSSFGSFGIFGNSKAVSEDSIKALPLSTGFGLTVAAPSFASSSVGSGATSATASVSDGIRTPETASFVTSFSAESSFSLPSTGAMSTVFPAQASFSEVSSAPSFSFGGATSGLSASAPSNFAVSSATSSIPSLGVWTSGSGSSNTSAYSFGAVAAPSGFSAGVGAAASFGAATSTFGAATSTQQLTPFGAAPSFGAQPGITSAKDNSSGRQSGRGAGRGRGRR